MPLSKHLRIVIRSLHSKELLLDLVLHVLLSVNVFKKALKLRQKLILINNDSRYRKK